jgi:hypothetical protein
MSDYLCYLRVSGIYVHENCCLGVQRHPLTYVERRRFQDGPETMFQMGVTQIWYLVSVNNTLVIFLNCLLEKESILSSDQIVVS